MVANFKKNRGSGDSGMTDLLNSRRIKKTSPEIKAIGLIDELNCAIGFLKARLKKSRKSFGQLSDLENIQKNLFKINALIAGAALKSDLSQETIKLEAAINALSKQIGPIKEFVIPGKSENEAIAHLARAKTRIVEISVRELKKFNQIAIYFNRLSDYLFLLAIFIEQPR